MMTVMTQVSAGCPCWVTRSGQRVSKGDWVAIMNGRWPDLIGRVIDGDTDEVECEILRAGGIVWFKARWLLRVSPNDLLLKINA